MTRPVAGRAPRRGVARALGGDGISRARSAAPADHADEPAQAPRWYRYLLWPVLACAGATGAMLAGGVPGWRAALIAVAAAVALWAVIVSMTITPPEWPYDAPVTFQRAPSSWEVSGLVGAEESDVSFQQYLRPRLWALAQELLRRRGIDPLSARARAMVGAREYDLLCGADTDSRRTTASVSVLCHTIARLATVPMAGSEPPIRNPALAGLAGRSAQRRAVRPGGRARKTSKGN